jgi:hypothetical protein
MTPKKPHTRMMKITRKEERRELPAIFVLRAASP